MVPMPSVLIAGCGYVGAATADLFHEDGWQVEGWTSSAKSAASLSTKPYSIRAVDIGSRAAIGAAAKDFDTVIHCASSRGGDAEAYRRIYLEGAQNLSSVFSRALLLFTSSTSVYAQKEGEWVSELSSAEPTRATGRILRETEEFVLGSGGVVARLAGIYGPGRSALLRKFLAGTAIIHSGEERFINQVHRDDIASALFLLTQRHLKAASRAPSERPIYNVSDNHPMTQRACYEWLAFTLQRTVPLTDSAPAERKRGHSNKRVNSEKLQRIGWRARYPTFEVAMTASILPDLECFGA